MALTPAQIQAIEARGNVIVVAGAARARRVLWSSVVALLDAAVPSRTS